MNKVNHFLSTDYAYKQNIFGRNIGVAVLDTGVYPHIDFTSDTNRLLSFYDCVSNESSFYDDNGHGTHVASIIGGNGKASSRLYHGIAPLCNIIGIKILNKSGIGSITNVQKGLEWVISNKEKYNIRIVNISVGGVSSNSINDNRLIKYVESAWDNGLVVLTAAGNLGPKPNTITIPGTSKKIITVGTLEDYMDSKTNNTIKRSYSGCGPTSECIVKPEVLAPGDSITACNTKNGYTKKSGTSMSTPIVSGIIALLLEKYPFLSNKQVKQLLNFTSKDVLKGKNRQGWGLIDIPALLDYI